MENFAIPWTFIVVCLPLLAIIHTHTNQENEQLFGVSLATIIALVVTIIFYNFTYLSPHYNLILNSGISFFWALGLGLLSWSVSTSHVLAKACTGNIWGGEAEAGVCRDYKALWGMTLVGT